jgi:hypothetical protein
MASPFAAYLAGIGTVVVALGVGFGGGLMLTSTSPSQKEQRPAYQKRVDAKFEYRPEKPAEPVNPQSVNMNTPVSPIMAAALAPTISTAFNPPAPPALWPPAIQSTAQETPTLAPDPGMRQLPVRPVAPVEAVIPARDWKKKKEVRDAFAQRKTQRKQIAVEQTRPKLADAEPAEGVVEKRTITTYAPEPRPAPLGIFNMLLGGN